MIKDQTKVSQMNLQILPPNYDMIRLAYDYTKQQQYKILSCITHQTHLIKTFNRRLSNLNRLVEITPSSSGSQDLQQIAPGIYQFRKTYKFALLNSKLDSII
ncbi:hypothetical protein SS50377_22800 [Spironucleus salmonicida]|uniref:Uncharacterized protein n=1 Tax=Spironucleus salmonicida TaxID=348837 RepID=A0A9P8LW75_9EUKA|nr:hypothetical protein SS50377_22800 [Spironucleus salmonicida]